MPSGIRNDLEIDRLTRKDGNTFGREVPLACKQSSSVNTSKCLPMQARSQPHHIGQTKTTCCQTNRANRLQRLVQASGGPACPPTGLSEATSSLHVDGSVKFAVPAFNAVSLHLEACSLAGTETKHPL